MAVEFSCSSCGKAYRIKDELAGKQAKCNCGTIMTVPTPPVDEADDAYRLAPLLNEELGSAPVAGGTAATTNSGGCPSCSQPIDAGAVLCIHCGYNIKTGKKMDGLGSAAAAGGAAAGGFVPPGQAEPSTAQPRRKASVGGVSVRSLAKGTAFSAVGAAIGAIIWAGIAYITEYELGIIAWAIGGMAGVGMAAGHADDDEGTLSGVIAAGMALFGICLGKFLFVMLWLNNDGMEMIDEASDREYVAEILAEDDLRSRQIDPDDADESVFDAAVEAARPRAEAMTDEQADARVRLYYEAERDVATEILAEAVLAKADASGDGAARNAAYDEAYETVVFMSDQEVAQLIEQSAEESSDEVAATNSADADDTAAAGESSFAALIVIAVMMFFFSFGLFDIIFVVLALGTAFKLGSGRATD